MVWAGDDLDLAAAKFVGREFTAAELNDAPVEVGRVPAGAIVYQVFAYVSEEFDGKGDELVVSSPEASHLLTIKTMKVGLVRDNKAVGFRAPAGGSIITAEYTSSEPPAFGAVEIFVLFIPPQSPKWR